MADNVQITPGTGVLISTKDIGGGIEVQRVMLTDDSGLQNKNAASDEALILLRRLVRISEALAAVDNANRQRVNVDSFAGQVMAFNAGAVGATVPRFVTANESPIGTIGGMDREMYINIAKNTFANAIRNRLTFV
jgi:hypothetical protein